jgi:hypothetical protein
MPNSQSRALRNLVAELSTASPGDIDAIISGLDGAQKSRIQALLSELQGERVAADEAGADSGVSSLSPWLAERVSVKAHQAVEFKMTASALKALRTSAAAVQADVSKSNPPEVVARRSPPKRSRGLFGWRPL